MRGRQGALQHVLVPVSSMGLGQGEIGPCRPEPRRLLRARARVAQSVLRIPGHEDDVNAVAFVDESPHILASGSDDFLIKARRAAGRRGAARA